MLQNWPTVTSLRPWLSRPQATDCKWPQLQQEWDLGMWGGGQTTDMHTDTELGS